MDCVQCAGKEFRFNKQNLDAFLSFIKAIYESHFDNICSSSFIERTAYKWITTIVNEGKSTEDFYYFLKDKVDLNVQKYCFYYPVINLHIENNFTIGDILFSFFSKRTN